MPSTCSSAIGSSCGSCGRAPSVAKLAAVFELSEHPGIAEWLAEHDLASPDGPLLLRRTLDAQGRSRAWINGRPATLAQLKDIGEQLVDLHGQHAHQSLTAASVQRSLVDAFGGFTALARATASAWHAWNAAVAKREAAAEAATASAAEREVLEARRRELAALDVSADEWAVLTQAQSRLAHAAALIEAAAAGEEWLDRRRRRAFVAASRADREARRPFGA